MNHPRSFAIAISLAVGLAASAAEPAPRPAAEAKPRPAPTRVTFGAYEVLGLATVDKTTYSPRSMMLVRTENPAAILLLASNQSESQLQEKLRGLGVDGCKGGVGDITPEQALMLPKVSAVASDLLLRSARSGKPPTVHDAQTLGQSMLRMQLFVLRPHFPIFLCEFGMPRSP